MKSLIVSSMGLDVDRLCSQLRTHSFDVQVAGSFEAAIDAVANSNYDVIFLSAMDVNNVQLRSQVLRLRSVCAQSIYIVTLGVSGVSGGAERDNQLAGENVRLPRMDFASSDVNEIGFNVNRLRKLSQVIGNNSIDFPSAGGIIARSAFNQLYLSALDRSNRHGDQSAVITIALENYDELYNIGGNYIADFALAVMSKTIVTIRRQTDIVGQIGGHNFSLLLQSLQSDAEPIEAAKRFAKTLAVDKDLEAASPVPMHMRIDLTMLPSGRGAYSSLVKTRQDADDGKVQGGLSSSSSLQGQVSPTV